MSFAAILLAPFALLLPAANGVPLASKGNATAQAMQPADEPVRLIPRPETPVQPEIDPAQAPIFQIVAQSFRSGAENQVRIEQRITIRITPLQSNVQPSMLQDLPAQAPAAPRFVERTMGRCLPVSGIAGVQAAGSNRLILYMRDQRMVSAALERTCSARDFYSGFYVERSSDGQLCVNRDALQSRSGANCRLARLRQLVELGN